MLIKCAGCDVCVSVIVLIVVVYTPFLKLFWRTCTCTRTRNVGQVLDE